MMTRLKAFASFFLLGTTLLLFLAKPASAQDDKGERSSEDQKQEMEKKKQIDLEVDDDELKKFIRISKNARSLKIQTQKKMRKKIEEADINRERLGEIQRAVSDGDDPDMTEKEKEAYEKLKKEQVQVRKEMRKKMKKKVRSKGMKWKRYRKISQGINRQPDLRQRYRKMMKKEQKGKEGQGSPKKKQKGSPEKKE